MPDSHFRSVRRCAAALLAGVALAVVPTSLSGCGAADGTASAGTSDRVVATTVAPHGWLVRRIAGEDVDVRIALKGIASCHSGAPPEATVVALAEADLYLTAGIGAESGPWLRTIINQPGVEVVDLLDAARAGLPAELVDVIGDDPHAWTSPTSLRRQAEAATRALAARWPDSADAFRLRGAELDAELAAIEAEVTAQLADQAGTQIVVDHPAWTWLAAEHGIEQIAVLPHGTSASDRSLEEIRALMQASSIGSIIIQPQHDPRASRALADSVGADLISVDPLSDEPLAAISDAVTVIDRIAVAAPADSSRS